MPDDETLDDVAQKIAGINFNQIRDPNVRARVFELAVAAEQNLAIHAIRNYVEDVAHWFNKSDYMR